MIGSLTNTLLRKIPGQLLVGVASGEYRVSGSIIQSVTSGRIVGHLQETSAFSSLLSSGPMALPQMALEAVSVVQNEQIKAAVAVVQALQVANLALSGISIGVSIAGTALLARRIARVEQKVDTILPGLAAVARGIEGLRAERIADDFTRLRTLADQVEEAWLPSATHAEWTAIARDSHFLADSFERRARELNDARDRLANEPFIDAYALASGLRVTARLAAGQDDMARQAATARTYSLVALGEPIRLGRLVLAGAPDDEIAATPRWQERLDHRIQDFLPIVTSARERELAAAASAETLDELARQEISGRDWLEVSRSETNSPLLFLPVGRFDIQGCAP
ncbi:hypothetical protein QH494_20305 [Sphingomonas sp. AR_OL41]|uniref:hypothetical protein n=1 Tax=Sphingomonas sp. AR_OL41 TaxID=3042729 RepID=UPI0024816A82|nr:hypothetical protein [Sphingomonas sp. AR_OL41]MDH7974539.1 hypothetical protein [Sphingomonas sp. AR_OL41]